MAFNISELLESWASLNGEKLFTLDEALLGKLLELERSGKARVQFMKRIQSRINRLRSQRELEEVSNVSRSPQRKTRRPRP